VHVYEGIRAYIEQKGYKQGVVAQKAGMTSTKLNEIINGRRTLYADDLSAICLALNVSPEIFIEMSKQ
jgi:transcriptional regulator with XRE-family HTH domain